ncbi:cupin domain-containing protein [Methyloversatilis sp. XJ19-49]|uniref:cupin domain-containing protein n=1 Tax=Methyloversatilis sp. XJ19-49 TaxID=2963429 RepID=UPI00211BFF61|nr:cupin domain-containing protein [Methyloversatilis sp. XJ19-49]MCQ9379463.1 cupin domain-containing protein [Methyloversatilis sp. XJ19-49]
MNGNLFDDLASGSHGTERIDTLDARPGVRIERIVSTGQSSPPGFWYDQPDDEWVALLSGSATLRFADEDAPRTLQPGDWIFIAAHRRHRVEQTDAEVASVWLAVHLDPSD